MRFTFTTSLLAAALATASALHAQTPPAAPSLTPEQVAAMQAKLNDWPQLHRYAADDEALPAPSAGDQRVVFYGDSITDNWGHHVGTFFPGKPYVNRGISGQTTPQMLVRFQQDVVHLKPAAVVILAGTNDIAGNTGPSTPEMIEDNFRSMTSIAKQNHIQVILASITPAYSYPWKPGVEPVAAIRQVNQWLKAFCATENLVYLDYYTAMADDKGAMRPGLAKDGVHPTVDGYAVMAPLAEAAIARALKQ
jgi:lysophospholipase L1-like esterase